MKSGWITLLLFVLLPGSAQACAVCFGSPASQDTQALSYAILSLLGVLALVLAGIVAFFVHLARAARAANLEEISDSARLTD